MPVFDSLFFGFEKRAYTKCFVLSYSVSFLFNCMCSELVLERSQSSLFQVVVIFNFVLVLLLLFLFYFPDVVRIFLASASVAEEHRGRGRGT